MATISKERKESAQRFLSENLKPGDTIYTVLCNVSRSGMSREIKLYANIDGKMTYLSGYAEAMGLGRRGKRDGNIVGGCGMDMGFHLVYGLGRTIYPEGYDCIKPAECHSNDHSNAWHYKQQGKEVPKHHTDGGYAFRHAWL